MWAKCWETGLVQMVGPHPIWCRGLINCDLIEWPCRFDEPHGALLLGLYLFQQCRTGGGTWIGFVSWAMPDRSGVEGWGGKRQSYRWLDGLCVLVWCIILGCHYWLEWDGDGWANWAWEGLKQSEFRHWQKWRENRCNWPISGWIKVSDCGN